MPKILAKLSCGIIYTSAFADYLKRLHAEQASKHRHEVLALDYVRCASGPQQGTAWWQMSWVAQEQAPPSHRFRINEVEVFIHRQTQRGLRGRCLDHDGSRVVVRQ